MILAFSICGCDDAACDLARERRDAEPGLGDPLGRLQPHPQLLRGSGQTQGRHGAARVPGILQKLYFVHKKTLEAAYTVIQ